MEVSFKGYNYKSKESNPYLSKVLAVIFIISILAIAQFVDDYIQMLNYCIYAFFLVILYLLIYFIYYKLFASKYDIASTITFDNEYFTYITFKYKWTEMSDIQVMYRSHYVISGKEFNEINEFKFKYLGDQYNFHFILESEEDLQKYLEVLQWMYDHQIPFVESVSTIGLTKMMQPL